MPLANDVGVLPGALLKCDHPKKWSLFYLISSLISLINLVQLFHLGLFGLSALVSQSSISSTKSFIFGRSSIVDSANLIALVGSIFVFGLPALGLFPPRFLLIVSIKNPSFLASRTFLLDIMSSASLSSSAVISSPFLLFSFHFFVSTFIFDLASTIISSSKKDSDSLDIFTLYIMSSTWFTF